MIPKMEQKLPNEQQATEKESSLFSVIVTGEHADSGYLVKTAAGMLPLAHIILLAEIERAKVIPLGIYADSNIFGKNVGRCSVYIAGIRDLMPQIMGLFPVGIS